MDERRARLWARAALGFSIASICFALATVAAMALVMASKSFFGLSAYTIDDIAIPFTIGGPPLATWFASLAVGSYWRSGTSAWLAWIALASSGLAVAMVLGWWRYLLACGLNGCQ